MSTEMIVILTAVFTAIVGVFIAISGNREDSSKEESSGE